MASCPGTAGVLGPRASWDRGRPGTVGVLGPRASRPPFLSHFWEERVLMESGRDARGPRCGLGRNHSTPIVVKSWNQCCAWTKLLILGDSARGLVSGTTH